ncbi:MAG: phosphatase PAP2 family protein [Patescibacteria group bacterium]
MTYSKKILLNLTLLSLFVLLTLAVLTGKTHSFDQSFSFFVYSLRTSLLTTVMSVISFLGDIYAGIVISLLVVLFLVIKKHQRDAVIFSLSLIIVEIANHALKLIFMIPRPNVSALTVLHDFSYPSGHAMNNIFLYGMIVYYISRYGKSRSIKLYSVMGVCIWVTLIGFSRVYLGVHYPTDVLAGYLVGLWSLTTVLIVPTILAKKN